MPTIKITPHTSATSINLRGGLNKGADPFLLIHKLIQSLPVYGVHPIP
jgi:hypothetical protein